MNTENQNIPYIFPSEKDTIFCLQGFYDKVEAAQKEFKIDNVIVIVKGNLLDGELRQYINHATFGNKWFALPMAAYALAEAKKEQEQKIKDIISGNYEDNN